MAGRPGRRAKLAEMAKVEPVTVEASDASGKALQGTIVYQPIRPVKKDKGRFTYSEDLAVEIINRVANGEALTDICAETGMPMTGTFLRWLTYPEHAPLREAYALAREACGQWHADQALKAATQSDDPQRGRLAFDAYRWAASKYFPKHFGDKVQLSNAAGDGDATLAIRNENTPLIGELVALIESRRAALSAPQDGGSEASG